MPPSRGPPQATPLCGWSITILQILEPDVIVTHAQLADVYLLGPAVQNRGKLAPLDQRIPVVAVHGGRKALELIIP